MVVRILMEIGLDLVIEETGLELTGKVRLSNCFLFRDAK